MEWMATKDVGNLKLIESPKMVLFIYPRQNKASIGVGARSRKCTNRKAQTVGGIQKCADSHELTDTIKTTEKMFISAKNTTLRAADAAIVSGWVIYQRLKRSLRL